MQTVNLTELFGIRSVYTALFFGTDRVCVVSAERVEASNLYTAAFIDIARERILGEAQFVRSGYLDGLRTQDENACFLFEQYIEEINDVLWEELLVSPDGELTSRSLLPNEGVFLMPDGGWILERNSNLYLRTPGANTLQTLLTGVPFDSDSENVFDSLTYRFFQALDDHRFVYECIGWEWSDGYGVYDLLTGKDRLLDKSGAPCLIYEGKLYATTAIVDLNTYQKEALPEAIQAIMNGMDASWALSPDGRTLCVLVAPYNEDASLEFYHVISGKRLETVPLGAGYWEMLGYLSECAVGFCGYTRESNEALVCICSTAF